MSTFIDETGNRYGKLVVIKQVDNSKCNRIQWLCQCDCGNAKIVEGTKLRGGFRNNCGCLRAKNIIGQRFGRLIAISRAGSSSSGDATWLCRCDCNKELIVSGNSLRFGNTKSCGCLRHELECLPFGEAAFNAIVCGIKGRAKRKHLEWSLTDEQIRLLLTQPCYYCGAEPTQTNGASRAQCNGIFLYNGLDRIDSSLGYVIENIVSCCGICNRAKYTLSVTQFKDWVIRIHDHFCKDNCL